MSETDELRREQEILDTALRESDQLLARSLHDDEVRRRRRWIWSLTILVLGGSAMATIFLAITMGWFATTTQLAAEAEKSPSSSDLDKVERASELTTRGWEVWKKQEFAQAEKIFERAVGLDSENVDAWNGLGWSQFNQGKAEQAIEAFETGLKLAPQHAAMLNGLGQIHLQWKEYEEAENYFLKAVETPGVSAAWWGLTNVYLLTEQFDEAIPWAEKIVSESPNHPRAKQMLAAAKAKKLDDTLRRQLEPAGKESTHGKADFQQGWAHFNKGQFRPAERIFRTLHEEDPDNPNILNGLAWALLNQGKRDEAKPLFEKVLKVNPEAGGAMNGMAIILKAEGKVDEAIQLWEKMLESSAGQGPNAATVGLANTYLEQQQFAKAAKYYEQLVESQPNNAFFKQKLAQAKAGMTED